MTGGTIPPAWRAYEVKAGQAKRIETPNQYGSGMLLLAALGLGASCCPIQAFSQCAKRETEG